MRFARSNPNKFIILTIALLVSDLARAHFSEGATGGFLAGVLHPISGLDHLLAMVSIGIWGATLGRPLIWILPIAFPMMMVVGGVLGISGIYLPYVESGIATSVVVLGLAIACAWRAPVVIALLIVSVFGIFHGYAHGVELPTSGSPSDFVAGFVVCTGTLHVAGIGLGTVNGYPAGRLFLRLTGTVIASSGVWILFGMPSFG